MGIAIVATTFNAAVSQTSAGTSQLGDGGGSSAALQAQLDRCTRQLGDWVNCSSGKTPAGKQIIQALQDKISTIKAEIQSQQAQDAPQTQANNSTTTHTAPTVDTTSDAPPVSLSLAALGSVGTLLHAVA